MQVTAHVYTNVYNVLHFTLNQEREKEMEELVSSTYDTSRGVSSKGHPHVVVYVLRVQRDKGLAHH